MLRLSHVSALCRTDSVISYHEIESECVHGRKDQVKISWSLVGKHTLTVMEFLSVVCMSMNDLCYLVRKYI